jgi:hypothetical protein
VRKLRERDAAAARAPPVAGSPEADTGRIRVREPLSSVSTTTLRQGVAPKHESVRERHQSAKRDAGTELIERVRRSARLLPTSHPHSSSSSKRSPSVPPDRRLHIDVIHTPPRTESPTRTHSPRPLIKSR